MILFDFKCPRCNNASEEMVMDSEVQPLCPVCHTFMERQVSAVGMVKGNFESKRGFRDRSK